MRTWYSSYAIHVLLWVILASLAPYVKAVAQAPAVVFLLAMMLPYIIVVQMLDFSQSSVVYSRTSALYTLFWGVLAIGWPVAGFFLRWRYPVILLVYFHLIIAFAGLLVTGWIGLKNFPIRL